MKFEEFLRYVRVEVGIWFAECHDVCRSISTKCEFKALIPLKKFVKLFFFFFFFFWLVGIKRRRNSQRIWMKRRFERISSGIGGKVGPIERGKTS